MSSATASTTSVRLRDIRALNTPRQVAAAVVVLNLVLGGAFLGLYTQAVATPYVFLGIGGGNLVVGGLGLRSLSDWLQEVTA